MKKILIVDDHEVVREGVKRILEERYGAVVFGEASTVREALALTREKEWDVAVLDLTLAGQSGLDVLKELKQIRPGLPVVILSMHSEEQYARRAFRAGAAAYVTKDSPRTELVKALNTVASGGRYISSSIAERLITALEQGVVRPIHESLSAREFEVLRLIGLGRTVREIAGLLSLSDKTISTYRARVLRKMLLKNNAQLIHYAVQNKLLD